MQIKKFAIVFLAVCFLFSCKQYAIKKYQIGRDFDFKTRSAFAEYLNNKKLMPADHFVYADSLGFRKIISDIIKNSSSEVFLGYYLSDSIVIKRSSFLAEKSYCAQRIQGELEKLCPMKSYEDSLKEPATKLLKYRLRRITDDAPLETISHPLRKTILLLYFVGYGTYYDHLYQSAYAIQQRYAHQNDIYVICLDPVYLLKP